jgi:hypothetical protein
VGDMLTIAGHKGRPLCLATTAAAEVRSTPPLHVQPCGQSWLGLSVCRFPLHDGKANRQVGVTDGWQQQQEHKQQMLAAVWIQA